jgi:hypothetical protein
MNIGFQATLLSNPVPNISIDGNIGGSTTTSTHIFSTVATSTGSLVTASYTTLLSASNTNAFALSAFVQLTAAPGGSTPTFAYWTLTVVGCY